MKRIACIHWTDADCKSPIERCELQIVERCGQFSPLVGFDPADPRSIFLDITGLAHLFGGETAMAEAIVRDLAALGYTIRVAVADTIGAAWAAVHYYEGEIENCKFENLKFQIFNLQSSAFLHPLPIEALRLPAEIVRLLHELGLVRIGQLEALPREEFLSRFGPLLLQRMDQAFARLDEPVPACVLQPKFEAGWSAEHPTVRRDHRRSRRVADCPRGGDVGPLRPRRLRLDCRLFLENNAKSIRHTPREVGCRHNLTRSVRSTFHNATLIDSPVLSAGHCQTTPYPLARRLPPQFHQIAVGLGGASPNNSANRSS